MRVGLVSAKGTPGVTTTAAVLAAVGDGVLIEADPSGGSVEAWTGPVGEPGLIGWASSLRRAITPEALAEDAVTAARPGVKVVLAPASGAAAESALAAIGDRVDAILAGFGGQLVLVDGGRWSASQSSARRLTGCEVVGLVCSPTVASASAARWLVGPLAQTFRVPVRLVLVGDRPCGPGEMEAALDAAVAGVVPVERQSVAVLWSRGTTRGWQRSGLARAGRAVLAGLVAAVTPAAAVVGRG